MAESDLPPPETLRQLLRYEPESGKLFWLPRSAAMFTDSVRPAHTCAIWNAKYAGKEALACVTANRHLEGAIFGRRTFAHRAIWAIVHGVWPAGQIDHINGDGLDNSISNLRDIPQAENQRNMKRPSNNKSGVSGVCWDARKKRWSAIITHKRKRIYLGRFMRLEDAAAAREKALVEYGFHPNHGRS